jgi:two-component system, NtrC family, sensor kinase
MSRQMPNLGKVDDLLRENQKLIAIGRLAASIAHEINNPLEAVTNLLFLMGEERDLSPNARTYLTLAQKELSRVVQISKQTLNFYRESLAPVPVQLEELMEEALGLYERKIAEKKLTLRRQYTSLPAITLFPGEMRQIFSNLIVNAIEAAPKEGLLWIRLRPTRRWSDSTVRGIRVTIADNGSGIAPATRKQLGRPFLTTKGQQGTGLGLWVAMSIIQRNRGGLQIYSSTRADRHGSAFSVFLPTNMRPQAVVRSTSVQPENVEENRDDDASLETAC